MAFYDWNHDGKKDFVDDYLEYNIYKKSTGNNSSNSSSGGFFGKIYEPAKPCMAIGCMEDRSGSSIYCIEHRWEYE